mmetsp:Transcript_7966/g.15284  ORF Transcript_7966/g.15284 Transcript_7966/m.15284 type:complete len:262 (-) Transcript_7966:1070-1855(-)
MGPWPAIQSLRPARAEASQTGNHVPRRERRSPSLHEGELPCVQVKQRERHGPSACCSEGRDAFARRSRRHRAWPPCCVLLRRESAFVGESPGHTASHSLDEANGSLSTHHQQRCRLVGDLPTRGANRLPSECRCARQPRSPPHVERQTLPGSTQGEALGRGNRRRARLGPLLPAGRPGRHRRRSAGPARCRRAGAARPPCAVPELPRIAARAQGTDAAKQADRAVRAAGWQRARRRAAASAAAEDLTRDRSARRVPARDTA